MTPAEPDRLTIDEIAQHLRVTRWVVGLTIKAGGLAAERVPGRGRDGSKRIPLPSYLAYLRRSTVARQRAEDKTMTAGQPTTLPTLHRFEDVAETYGIKLRGLLRNAKQIEHIHIGHNHYFTDAQLAAYLASRTRKPAKVDDGLDGVRARRARRKVKAGTPERDRSAA